MVIVALIIAFFAISSVAADFLWFGQLGFVGDAGVAAGAHRQRGLTLKIEMFLTADLEHAWEVLGEAVQTVLRAEGIGCEPDGQLVFRIAVPGVVG